MKKRLFEKVEKVFLDKVTKRYGATIAVDKVSLEIEGGELFVLIGPSGSGKTTTLKMINRMIEPDEGSIFINGEDVRKFDVVLLRRNMGYVIQNIGLFPHMKVKDNISLLMKLEGYDEQYIEKRVKELLELVDLPPKHFMDRYPYQLSGGQQQRVGLARALALDPPLLLMDEPFGALDPILRKQLQEEFEKIKWRLGKTIVFVTHDVDEAFRLGDRIGIMNDGKIIQVGEPDELLFSPKNEFVEKLIGADRKYRYFDKLKVSDIMNREIEKYIFDLHKLGKNDIISLMEEKGVEFGIIVDKGVFLGIVYLKDLYSWEEKALPLIRNTITASPRDSLQSVIYEMKRSKARIIPVIEDGSPIGILLPDEILFRLI